MKIANFVLKKSRSLDNWVECDI